MPDAISYAGPELDELVRMLMACTPLGELSSMQARVVFELLLQRGYRIVKADTGGANARILTSITAAAAA